eukprot:TRINITY_DN2280_c0_g1_i1.p1 TRINITY_DN2280_c0_g1~~TRINITY_DN2280_c0_g1_i1.p1  ORF type:complete len:125 (+),score=18.28 TRINITY_DN2280_c0_g1_i1:184-558(+)
MRYMVCLDGSEQAKKAFDFATRLIQKEDMMYLVTILRTGIYKDDAQMMIMKYEQSCMEMGIPYEAIIVEGNLDPRDAIINMVEKYMIDTLVVGTRGMSTIKKMFLGSVSSYCVTNAPCDVLVAK